MRGSEDVGGKITVYIIVVPQEAKELKQSIEQRIEELRQRGEQEMQRFLDNLEEELLQWATQEVRNLACFNPALVSSMILGPILYLRRKRT